MNLTIPILSKEEFRKLLLDHLVNSKKDWSTEDIMEYMLEEGLPKLNFEDLGTCLPKMFVFLPTIAVEVGDFQFIWVVSGNKAILVNKTDRSAFEMY